MANAELETRLRKFQGGVSTLAHLPGGFLGLAKIPQDLPEGKIIDWGTCENAVATPLNSDPRAIYLQEDANLAVHRIEQIGVPVIANQANTVDVIARARGRDRLMIEFRDLQAQAYTRATFNLGQARVDACVDKDAVAIGPVDEEWVRCQLTLVPTSDVAVFNVTLVDQEGAHVYQGTDDAGIDIRSPVIGRIAPHALVP
jgi:hypothetical protein